MSGTVRLPFVCAFTVAVLLALPAGVATQRADFAIDVRTYVQAQARFSLAAARRVDVPGIPTRPLARAMP
jgi:hypothetical protein